MISFVSNIIWYSSPTLNWALWICFIMVVSNGPLIYIILTLIPICFITNETQNKANGEKQKSHDINEHDGIGAYVWY